jgi:hypothetical protein
MQTRKTLIRLIGTGLVLGLLVGCGGDEMMDDGHMDDSMSRAPLSQSLHG